jgi:acyl carrier protein
VLSDGLMMDKLLDIIELGLGWPLDRTAIDKNATMGDGGLGLDSLMVVEAAVQIEMEFGIEIPDDDIVAIGGYTLETLGSYVEQRMATAQPSAASEPSGV